MLGHNRPKLQNVNTKLESASGGELQTLGKVVLDTKIGNNDYPISYYVVRNLVTSVILGRRTLDELKAVIDCDKGTLTVRKFSHRTDVVKSHKYRTVQAYATTDITIPPQKVHFVPCKSRSKVKYRGTHVALANVEFEDIVVNSLVDVNCKNIINVPVVNDTNHPMRISTDSALVALLPLMHDDQIYNIDFDEFALENVEKCNVVKKRGPKPTFSRPLCPDDKNESDESIVRRCIESKCAKLSVGQKEQLVKLVLQYVEAFSLRGELGRTRNFKYKLRFQKGAKFAHKQPYRLSQFERELMRAEIMKMLKLGVIERCDSYVPSVCPAFLLAKKDQSARILVDLRQVNRNLQPDYFSFPNIDDILCRIGEARPKMFCMADLSDSFFQLEIDEESRPYTAFTPYDGETFMFQTLPQGLSNSPSFLNHVTHNIFRGLDFIHLYADDFLLTSSNWSEHLEHLEQMFQRLTSEGLKLNLRKSVLFDTECEFVGHKIKDGHIRPLARYISAITNMPTPKDKPSLRRFLGAIQWLSKYIHRHSQKVSILYNLLKKNVPWQWTADHENAVSDIKEYLSCDPIVALPQRGGKLELFSDASRDGLGGLLIQERPDKSHVVIGYCSRTTTEPEKNKARVTELEIFALKFCLSQLHHLIYGRHLVAYTDHHALIGILNGNAKPASRKIASCLSTIGEYHVTVKFVRGSLNGFADLLSRNVGKVPDSEISNTICINFDEPPVLGISESCVVKSETVPLRRSARIAARQARLEAESVTSNTAVQSSVSRNSATTMKALPKTNPASTMNTGATLKHEFENSARSKSIENNVPKLSVMSKGEMKTVPGDLIADTLANRQYHQTFPGQAKLMDEKLSDINYESIDLQNMDVIDNHATHTASAEALFRDPKLKFSNKFHGSVPRSVRNKIRDLVKQNFSKDIDLQTVISEQKSDPYYASLIYYLKHQVLSKKKQAARRILALEDHFLLIDDCLFRLPNHGNDDMTKYEDS